MSELQRPSIPDYVHAAGVSLQHTPSTLKRPIMADPTDYTLAMQHLQAAIRKGQVQMTPCQLHPDIKMLADQAGGNLRLTYAKVEHGRVKAFAAASPSGWREGAMIFNLGYAVPEYYRGRGLAREIARKAIDDLVAGMKRNGHPSLWIEITMDVENVASQKVAAAVLGVEPESFVGEFGNSSFMYARRF